MIPTQGELPLQRARRLKIVLSLSSSYFAISIITVLTTGSLALLSEAGHVLADMGGIALALFAIIYTRKPATPERSYGFYRMEILASFVNSVILASLSVYFSTTADPKLSYNNSCSHWTCYEFYWNAIA
jgi:cobalt-zinc-cadmium efflux system protein